MKAPAGHLDERVVQRMDDLELQNAEDIARRFVGVPVEYVEDASGFFRTRRLLTTSHCAMHCQYPDEKVLWCHNEGLPQNGIKPSDMPTMVHIVRHDVSVCRSCRVAPACAEGYPGAVSASLRTTR